MSSTNKPASGEKTETILVVEDDTALRDGLAMNFQLQGYRVITAADGEEGMKKAFDSHPDLIILDIMLPGLSGMDILAELRGQEKTVPVLMLSARDTIENKVEGLELGADDYVTKPFELPELIARAEVMLRRQRFDRRAQPRIAFGQVEIDPEARVVKVAGQPVSLSAKEFDLLYLLARSPGRPLTRETILNSVWGWGFDGTARTVNNFIMGLRRKIEVDPTNPKHIKTVRQVGYKFEP